MNLLLALAVLAHTESSTLAASATTTPAPARKVASGLQQPPVELGEEWGPANEDQANEILRTTLKMLEDRSPGAPFMRRDAHPKHHGCAKASFKVDASALPPELRVGVFAPEAPKEYPAWIRFSNGSPDGATAPDIKADVRGMAIKLMNVEGSASGSQDFVLCTGEKFFAKNGQEYLGLHRALAKGTVSLGWFILTHPRDGLNVAGSQVKPGSPLQTPYFSALPYKLGPMAMRFKVVPCAGGPNDPVPSKKDAHPNYLRERLVSQLAGRSACFDFLVQPNRELNKQPVEDPTRAWNQTKSPYIKVATVELAKQDGIDSDAQLNLCENLSFDPWHSVPATRPLGQIGRMRGEIYPAISEFRHAYNSIPKLEPRSHKPCEDSATSVLCQAPKH